MATTASRAGYYRSFAKLTIATVYVLILLGGIVRSTGSGLGCPDWPRCFGRWVPPTEVSQLPPDYKTRYAEDGLPPSKVIFDPVLTWVEYLNRLFGALTGLFIFVTLVLAPRGWPFGVTFAAFLLTGLQGWIGAKVVSTALMPAMITVHNALAQVIVYLLLAGYILSRRERQVAEFKPQERNLALLSWVFVILQFYLGLGVRQWVDTLTQAGAAKDAILADLIRGGHTGLFLFHRSFSWIVAALLLWQGWRYFRKRKDAFDEGHALHQAAIGCVVLNVLVGVSLQMFELSAFAQPLHLLLGSVLLGVLFALSLLALLGPKASVTAVPPY
jgi:heme a synthase